MKFWKIFRFEFAHQMRSIPTWIYLAVLLAYTILMRLLVTPGDGVFGNNTFYITGIIVMGGFIWLVMGAAIAGEAAARDVQTRMHPLTYATPISKFDYLGGRFLAAFAVNASLMLALPLGVLLSFNIPGAEDETMLPFRASAYLSVYFLIALPNAFVATALQFSFSALTRQVMTAYFASLILSIFPQLIAITAAQLFSNWDLVKLLDPVGVAGIINSELGTWTPTEKNTRLVTLEGMFLWNRILWLSVGAAFLMLTYLRFSFANAATKTWSFKGWRKTQSKVSDETERVRATAIVIPHVERSFGAATFFNQTLSIARASFVKIARNPAGLLLVAIIAVVSAAFGYKIMTQFGVPLLPTTQQVLKYVIAPIGNLTTAWVVIPLLIMYFAGQLVWNERDSRINDIADAAPAPEWALLSGKFLGLGLIILVWVAMMMAGGMLMQAILGYTNFEIGLYLKTLFGLQLADYLLFALLAVVVHVVVNHKSIGNLVTLLIFIFIAFPSTFKVEHNMLIFGANPGWWYTDMRGFGPTLWPWFLFKLYWIAWALLLAVAARLLWARGREQHVKHRLQLIKRRFTPTTRWVSIVGFTLLLTTGGFIFYNTNVVNEYQTTADFNKRKADYELRYGKYRNTPQPLLTATKLNVEIYPEKQQVDLRAVYTLVNKTSVSIDSIHLGSVSGIEPVNVEFNRAATGVMKDSELSHYIYALAQPLRPGDSLQLNFAVNYKQRGFRHNGIDELVMKNGSYFTNYDVLPDIGYQRYREISDAVTRKKYRLAPRPELPLLYDSEARKKPLSTDQNTFEAIVGTAKDEVAVAPGTLQRTWTERGRSYFHFKTDAALRGEYSILSANYLVKESDWNGVKIMIYYHPDHVLNVDRILKSARASLEYYTEQFGPYPFGHLTIAEHAGTGGGASSEASMIDYGEGYAVLNPDDSPDGFAFPFYIMAHEIGHQWWGGAQVRPAHVEGVGVLIEGLAVYSGMQVLEKNYGASHLQQYVDFLHSFYEMPRSRATNSLLRANESFLYYRKGGLAMYVLSKYIGKEKVNGALRSLLQKHHSGALPLLTTLDLYDEIKAVTPDSLNYLLTDFFETNTYWRLKTKQFAAALTKAGSWEVTLKVNAQKVIVDSAGVEHEVPMNDWLEVGIYEESKNVPLYLKKQRIQSGDQTLKVTVPRKPQRGGIDPNSLMIDVRRDDNLLYLQD